MGFLSELCRTAISAIPANQGSDLVERRGSNSRNSATSPERHSRLLARNICSALGLSIERIARRINFGAVADCDDRVLWPICVRSPCESIGKKESSRAPTPPPLVSRGAALYGCGQAQRASQPVLGASSPRTSTHS